MFAAIRDGVKSLVDGFTAVFDFIVDFFSDLVFVIKTVGNFVIKIPGYFMWLPTELVVLVALLFSVVVIYLIIGRK